jgi:hypothetical protein
MTVSDLLEQPQCNKSDNAIKLVTTYKLLTACSKLVPTTANKQCEHNLSTACEQICNNLCVFYVCSRCTHVRRTSCYKTLSANTLLQICSQAVDKLCSHCLFPVVVTSLEQAVDNFWQAWWHYQTCYKVVLTSLIQSWYNKNVTRLTTQGCNNIVISWLNRTCWNNLATSLIISTSLLQVINCLFQTCWQLGRSSTNTTCWWFDVRFFHV